MFVLDLDMEAAEARVGKFEMARSLSGAARRELFDRIRQMEAEGYDFAAADGALELLVRDAAYPNARPFEVSSFEVTTRSIGPGQTQSTASVSIRIHEGIFAATATRNGPVNALDTALRQCLSYLFPAVAKVELTNYRMQLLEQDKGTAAKASVLIDWRDDERTWSTMGVSYNIIEASWLALVSGIRLELMRLGEVDYEILRVEDNSWAV
jgi:2-isopropylmalate synthase